KMLRIENVKDGNVVTLHIRGFNEKNEILIEKYVKKAVKAAMDALKEGALPGGGAAKVAVAKKIRESAMKERNKQSMAMEEFASALEDVVKAMARNMGYDKEIAIAEMKKEMKNGKIKGLSSEGVKEMPTLRSFSLEKSEIERAGEASIMMIRISDVLSAKPLVKKSKYGANCGVIIYTSTGCPYCTKAKAYLRGKGISFKEINVSENPAAIQEMIRKSGQTGTPVMDIKGNIIVGYDIARIEAALRK
ncbi:MAG TPA: hypothetical protein ENG06_06220, partial [Thermoplasmatales archaeon]|nr:hypothetical protein [Thermoplasmatales archaeon]